MLLQYDDDGLLSHTIAAYAIADDVLDHTSMSHLQLVPHHFIFYVILALG